LIFHGKWLLSDLVLEEGTHMMGERLSHLLHSWKFFDRVLGDFGEYPEQSEGSNREAFRRTI
jgi:hypothetical protein